MGEHIVGREVAELEFQRWAEAMDLDVDVDGLDAEDLRALNKQKSRIVGAIQRGSLVISEAGEAVYTPANSASRHTDPITFHERTGASLMAMDSRKKSADAARTYAVMGDICRLPPQAFAGLVGIDIKVCEALFALLMD